MEDMFSLKNKVICVTGGTGLIGGALVTEFAARGAKVFVGTRTPEKHAVQQKKIKYLKLDVTQVSSIRGFIADVTSATKRIDVWVNCAWPRADKRKGRIEDVSATVVEDDVRGHVMGVYNCCKEILQQMKKNKRGSIVNFGSIYGEFSPDFRIYENTEIFSAPAYPLIEGGIHTFTKYLACYAAVYNIRVNAICPGGVLDGHSKLFQKQYSARVPLGRMADKTEMVGAAVFLASEASSYVTGHLLFVDGGLHAW